MKSTVAFVLLGLLVAGSINAQVEAEEGTGVCPPKPNPRSGWSLFKPESLQADDVKQAARDAVIASLEDSANLPEQCVGVYAGQVEIENLLEGCQKIKNNREHLTIIKFPGELPECGFMFTAIMVQKTMKNGEVKTHLEVEDIYGEEELPPAPEGLRRSRSLLQWTWTSRPSTSYSGSLCGSRRC